MASLVQQAQIRLLAAARVSGRPPPCATFTATSWPAKRSLWTRASSPHRQRYCRLVAQAQSLLPAAPDAAIAAAKAAQQLRPEAPGPIVLQGRAALLLGNHGDAVTLFDRALARDARSIDQPLAMLALARSQRDSGKHRRALRSYRKLVPRAALLPNRLTRASALLEAAHLAMAVGAHSDEAALHHHLDEALAFLHKAASDPHHKRHPAVILSLALALDRTGQTLQANALLHENHTMIAHWRGNPQLPPFVVRKADLWALRALASERSAAARAVEHWRQYLTAEGTAAAYRTAAQKRLTAVMTRVGRKTHKRRSR